MFRALGFELLGPLDFLDTGLLREGFDLFTPAHLTMSHRRELVRKLTRSVTARL